MITYLLQTPKAKFKLMHLKISVIPNHITGCAKMKMPKGNCDLHVTRLQSCVTTCIEGGFNYSVLAASPQKTPPHHAI